MFLLFWVLLCLLWNHADRIFMMEQGRIIEEGTHDNLVGKKGNMLPCGKHRLKYVDV